MRLDTIPHTGFAFWSTGLIVALVACGADDVSPGGSTLTSPDSGTTPLPVQCSGVQSRIDGQVTEDSLGGTFGRPLAFVSLASSPSIATLPATTDAEGNFAMDVPCSGTPYEIRATKQGYDQTSASVVPNRDTISVLFTLSRATGSYRFVPVTMLDYSTAAPLADARINVDSGQGATAFFSDAMGLSSVPVDRFAANVHFAFSKEGYHDVAGYYQKVEGSWSGATGVGRVAASPDGIMVKMVDSATASIPEACTPNDVRCMDAHTVELCVNGDWVAQLGCPAAEPWCNAGVCGVCSDEVRICIDAKTVAACMGGVPAEIYCGEQSCVDGECK